jgi:hypothetical protein
VVARPEIIMEGLDGSSGEWKEIHFRHKPGNTSKPPTHIIPHQPRLDWQMWFAALGHYGHNPWFVHLVYKLLQGNCPEVLSLLDEENYPFRESPPAAIRSTLFQYDFTRLNSSWARAIPGVSMVGAGSGEWWQRKGPGREYMPAIDKSNKSLKDYLKGNGVSLRKRVTAKTKNKDMKCEPSSEHAGLWYLQRAVCLAPEVRSQVGLSEQQWVGAVRSVLLIMMSWHVVKYNMLK